ncbi:MAG: hypothetical protein WCC25_14640 [Candidatus Korobacteraceae bacterium]
MNYYRQRGTWFKVLTVVLVVYAALGSAAQDQPAPKTSSPDPGKPITVVGCLTGYDGRYTLGTSNDTLYLLVGDSTVFKRLNARMVQVSGNVTEPPPHTSRDNVLSQQPPTLTVAKLKKVADGCN